jgi:predicted nucleotidyltransferase
MSGGGRSGYFPSSPDKLRDLIRRTQEITEQKRLDSNVNEHLQQLLIKLNQRNSEQIKQYLDDIVAVLGENYEVERLLFGGSVAKHTFVDGLSDVDALVILNQEGLEGGSPREVLQAFLNASRAGLTRGEVLSIDKGNMAMTVTYADGTEIQLLPALRHGKEISIPDAYGNNWKTVNPKVFHRELTRANDRLNHALVPTIKLAKSILSGLPEGIRPTGYHVEALSLEATRGYRGPMTVKSLLLHVLTAASSLVLHPISDVTNQSRNVDDYLGKKGSKERERLSQSIAGIARRLNAADTVDRWKEIVEA